MKFVITITSIFIILLTFIQKETYIKPLTPQDTILAFGDSLTYGYNAKENESYPAVLSTLSGTKIINEGILGETSADGLKRLPKLIKNNSFKLMILCFGGNDIMQGVSMDTLKSNLKAMIHMAKAKDIDVLLISVPNLTLFGLSPLELYEEVADEENIPLLSGILADILEQPSLKSDQVHPNALGYKIMAEKIYEKLQEEGWVKD